MRFTTFTIDRAAVPFVLVAALPAVVSAWMAPGLLTLVLAVLPVAVALFFRDPARSPPAGADLVLAPADGRVMHAGPARPGEAPPGEWLQVTIFLSLFDVHINRAPVDGRVTRVDYLPGSFRPAFRPESAANERSEIWIDRRGVAIVTRQVVGVLARRVVCRVRPGDVVQAGDRIGLMKFGSRMDVFLPTTADIVVRPGASVAGGETVVARLAENRT